MNPQEQPTSLVGRVARPFQVFARYKVAGALVLLGATLLAIGLANSRWSHAYHELLHMELAVRLGAFELQKSLHHWINDGLMGLFFFVVGLEIKREVLVGELSSLRKAALPIVAAIGGMVVPAACYLALNLGGPGEHGWGIPMATDIAFALGALSFMGDRVPLSLKVFLTALAIVDDLGAILVIAVFYTEQIGFASLGVGAVLFAVSIGANLAGVRGTLPFFILGAATWLAFLQSGVHATLAAVLIALTIPARTGIDTVRFRDRMTSLLQRLRATRSDKGQRLLTKNEQNILHDMETTIEQASAPLQQLEHALMPMVTFVVLPVFALANAGLTVSGGLAPLADPVALGVLAGLLLGKPLGVVGFSWVAIRLRLAELPAGAHWPGLLAVGVLTGVGFTMSLFVGGLAFSDPARIEVAKTGILGASLVATLIGLVACHLAFPRSAKQPGVL